MIRSPLFDEQTSDTGSTGGGDSSAQTSAQTGPAADIFSQTPDEPAGPTGDAAGGQTPPTGTASQPPATPPTGTVAPTAGAAAPKVSPQPTVGTQQTQSLSAQQIAELAAQTAAKFVPQQTQTQTAPKTFSQEDFNKAFNIPTVSPEHFEAMFGFRPEKPEQIQALNNFAQSIIRGAVTMANFQLDQARQQLESRVGPALAYQKEQVDTVLQNDFYTSNPQFKDFKPLIGEIAKSFKAEGKQFESKVELFKALADKAASLLGRALPSSSVNTGTQSTNGTAPVVTGTQRRMTPTSVGGQVSSSQSASGTNGVKALFG